MSTTILAERIDLTPLPPRHVAPTVSVSVVIPCFNEERFIGQALENLVDQYAAKAFEIIIVDGLSSDRTREIIKEFQQARGDVCIRIVDNPERNIPRALNLGIAAARGEIIARMDAHAAPSPGYIRRCVELLRAGDAEVVGMPCRVRPGAETTMARAIAIGVSHPFWIGDAKYRLTDGARKQELVDTVAFACFRKSLWAELGGFDEKLLTNEDYDFNYRARLRGNRVLLDSSEHCDYFARPTLRKLAAQYFRYGTWKARMIKQQPGSIKVRHLVAPLFVLSLVSLALLGLWSSLAWKVLALQIATYFLAAFAFSFRAARKQRDEMFMLPLVFLTIHFSWGASFLISLARPNRKGQTVS